MRLLKIILIGVCLVFATLLTAAQDEPPAPQYLYRDGNHLILVNGYTGEMTQLPIEVGELDRFRWSSDGRYLLAFIREEGRFGFCFNLYDVDILAWVYDEPISCGVQTTLFTMDMTQLYFGTSNEDSTASLWQFDLANETREELYRTFEGTFTFPDGMSSLEFSPMGTYLTFIHYHQISGGTLNRLVVMNVESRDFFTVYAPDTFYASYHPIWSDDDEWFLITMKDRSATSSTLPVTNHEGDVYLFSSETGGSYRLTFTPTVYERDVRWTDDGRIAFTEVIERNVTYTIEEAQNIVATPSESIDQPEPFDGDEIYDPLRAVTVSPDANVGAWVTSPPQQGGDLNIGYDLLGSRTSIVSIPLPPGYEYQNILIGWRPSDYPYP